MTVLARPKRAKRKARLRTKFIVPASDRSRIGLTVIARIDHAAGATEVGLSLRPTEVLIFGNAKAGTPPMQSVQTIGIDLPLKALAWQDASGKTWLSSNAPAWLANHHGLSGETEAATALDAVAKAATG